MSYRDMYEQWLASPALSDAEKAELQAIAADEKEIESRFFAPLDFGTAGLRGTMCVGLHQMNVHVIRHTTQAFAEVILAEGPEAVKRGVAVCFDCRNNSQLFAREAARVMAGNGIPVRLFESLRPTPELSFAVREYGCIAGINVTASHNPKEYNGYKVYWEDGAQLPPVHADEVAKKMKELDVFTSVKLSDYDQAVADGLITIMGAETDEKFLANVMAQANDPAVVAQVADTFKMVYTPFHGTGYKLIPEALRRLGMKHVICVPEQMRASPWPWSWPRRRGPTSSWAPTPTPTVWASWSRPATATSWSSAATRPACCCWTTLSAPRSGRAPCLRVAQVNGLQCYDTFTGFKFLAEKKDKLESTGEGKVLMSYEESYGYMVGDYVRDKDAVSASMLLSEMAAWYASQGMTLYDALQALYQKYGFYAEKTLNLVMPGLDGLKKMADLMAGLRQTPPAEIAGTKVAVWKDYKDGSAVNAETGEKEQMENVLRYEMADSTSVIVRPSGTEPKVKVYILANGATKAEADEKVAKYAAWAESLKG